VVEASALAELDERQLRRLVREADVFARVSPVDKYQIVRALQQVGEVVAMTGDGINDAAALRAADIGIAMGARGTAVARDVADVVLLDDDFGTIVKAIEHGRTVHTNIGKAVRFLLATNASEILVTVGGLAVGVARPMTALQFLWINLLSDVAPALALAVEPAEPDVMTRPPRDPGEPILSSSVLTAIGRDAGVLSAVTLAAQGLGFAGTGNPARASTVAFSTLTTAQLLHAFSYRSTAAPTRLLGSIVGGSVALQALALAIPPLRRLLGLAPIGPAHLALVAAAAAVPLALRARVR
jgi:Ca2+-transporting ATPase